MNTNQLATLPAMAQTPKDTTYNGWKNRQTWNVALWIGNDEGLYRAAVAYAKRRQAAGKAIRYTQFAYIEGLTGRRTPDGVAWTGTRLDLKALNAMMAEFAEFAND